MKIFDLGFGKGFGKLSNTLIFEFFIMYSSHTSHELSFSGL